MPKADPYPKVRRLVARLLKEGLAPFGFSQLRSTAYFVRDRGAVRDVVVFDKMRTNSVRLIYGLNLPQEGEPSSQGLRHGRYLDKGESYNVKYEEHARSSIPRAIAAFQQEALPWFDQFTSEADVQRNDVPSQFHEPRVVTPSVKPGSITLTSHPI